MPRSLCNIPTEIAVRDVFVTVIRHSLSYPIQQCNYRYSYLVQNIIGTSIQFRWYVRGDRLRQLCSYTHNLRKGDTDW